MCVFRRRHAAEHVQRRRCRLEVDPGRPDRVGALRDGGADEDAGGEHADDAGRAFVARCGKVELVHQRRVVSGAVDLYGTGVRHVGQQCAERDDSTGTDCTGYGDDLFAERTPAKLWLEAE